MNSLDTKSLALHLIKEDLKYHQMVAGCSRQNVHIEFFPDMASVIKALLGQETEGSEWEDRYVTAMGKVGQLTWGNPQVVTATAQEVLKTLNEAL